MSKKYFYDLLKKIHHIFFNLIDLLKNEKKENNFNKHKELRINEFILLYSIYIIILRNY